MASASDNRTLTQVATDLARRWAGQRFKAVQAYGQILADYGAGRSSSTAAAGAYAKLDPKAFAAGGHYAANVAITGFDDLVLRVRLSVLPD